MLLICIAFLSSSSALFSLTWTTSGDNQQAISGSHTYNYKPTTLFTDSTIQTELDGSLTRTTIDSATSTQSKWAYNYVGNDPEEGLGSFRWLITDPHGGNGFVYNKGSRLFTPDSWFTTTTSSYGTRRDSGVWTFNPSAMAWRNNHTSVSWQYDKTNKTWTSSFPGNPTGSVQWKYDAQSDLWLCKSSNIDWYATSVDATFNYTDPASPWYNTPAHERWFSWKLYDQFIWEFHYTSDLGSTTASDLKCITLVDSRTGAAHCKPYTTEAGCTNVSAPHKIPAPTSTYTRWFVPNFGDTSHRAIAEVNTQNPHTLFTGSGGTIPGQITTWISNKYTQWFLAQNAELVGVSKPNAIPSFLWKTSNGAGSTIIPPDYFVLPPVVVTMHQEIISTHLNLQEYLANPPQVWSNNDRTNTYNVNAEYNTESNTAPLEILTSTTQLLYNSEQIPTASKLSSFQYKNTDTSDTYEFDPTTGTWSNTSTGDSLTYGVVAAKKWANAHEITWQYNENTKTWTQIITTNI